VLGQRDVLPDRVLHDERLVPAPAPSESLRPTLEGGLGGVLR
jgi:hypothetical protein